MPRIFISIILIGLALILGVIFLWPSYQELNNLQVKIANKEMEIRYEDEYYEELSSISETLKEYQGELEKIDSALPTDQPLPSLLRYLQKATSENGIGLTNIALSIEPVKANARIKEIQGSLSLSGSYPALKNFLKVLEKSARLIKVDSISLSASASPFFPGFPSGPGELEGGISEIFNYQLSIITHSY